MKKTIHDLPADWKETVLVLYGEGQSDTEVRAELNMTYNLWKHLISTDVEFEDVIEHGRMLAKAWWMKQGRLGLRDKSMNAMMYKINMQNRFNWSDKASSTDDSDDEITSAEEIDKAIRKLTEKIQPQSDAVN